MAHLCEGGHHIVMLAKHFSGLWRHDNFRKLWAAQALSAFGGRITRTAMPMIAIITLNSPESLIGLLSAAGLVPVALAGFFGGGFVERSKKQRLMVALDLVRAGLLLLIPLAAWFGVLHIWLLFVCAAVAGAATALFQNADIAFLPRVVGREQLLEGNSKLQMTESIAEFVGPGTGGVLIGILTAPFAVIFNIATYLWSAYWLSRIKSVADAPETEPHRKASLSRLLEDIAVGWRAVMTSPPLRAAFLTASILQISWGFFFALYQLFVLRVLHLSPALVGIIISCGGVSGLIGAAITQPLVNRVGFGPAMAISFGLAQIGNVMLLLGAIGGPFTIPLLMGHQLFGDGFLVAFNILITSLRQTTVAENEIARTNALFQSVGGALLPAAAVTAGVIASEIGTQNAVMIGVIVGFIGVAPLLSPRLLALRSVAEAA